MALTKKLFVAMANLRKRWRCVFGEAWAAYEKAKAKERQQATQAKPGERIGQGNVSLTYEPSQSRDAIGARVGVSGRTYEKYDTIHFLTSPLETALKDAQNILDVGRKTG